MFEHLLMNQLSGGREPGDLVSAESFCLAQAVTANYTYANGSYDPSNTEWASYEAWYANAPEFAFNRYLGNPAGGNPKPLLDFETQLIPWFDHTRVFKFVGAAGSQSADKTFFEIEFLDSNDNVLGALKADSLQNSSYRVYGHYGPDKNNYTMATYNGSNSYVNGYLYFTEDRMYFKNVSGSNYTYDFNMTIDAPSIQKVRIKSYAYSATGAQWLSRVTSYLYVYEKGFIVP